MPRTREVVAPSVVTGQDNFVEGAKLDWSDVSDEEWREYDFGGGKTIRIMSPLSLNVKRKPEGDSHRIFAQGGISHYIPVGWISLKWKSKPGAPSFSF